MRRDSYHREGRTDLGVLRQEAFRLIHGKGPRQGVREETIIHHHAKEDPCLRDAPHDEYTFEKYPEARPMDEVALPDPEEVLEAKIREPFRNDSVHTGESGLLTWNDQEHDATVAPDRRAQFVTDLGSTT